MKTVLFKAFYLYCRRNAIEAMVVTGRFPIDRQYERLLFEEVQPGLGFVPLPHVGNLPHRIMTLDMRTVRDRWHAAKHPLCNFIFHTKHEDIDVGPWNAIFRPCQAKKVQLNPTFTAKFAVKSM